MKSQKTAKLTTDAILSEVEGSRGLHGFLFTAKAPRATKPVLRVVEGKNNIEDPDPSEINYKDHRRRHELAEALSRVGGEVEGLPRLTRIEE